MYDPWIRLEIQKPLNDISIYYSVDKRGKSGNFYFDQRILLADGSVLLKMFDYIEKGQEV